MNKPREFWIQFDAEDRTEPIHRQDPVCLYGSHWDGKTVHVIEYSAIESIRAENERLRSLIEENISMWLKHGDFYNVKDHEAWLEKAHNALSGVR